MNKGGKTMEKTNAKPLRNEAMEKRVRELASVIRQWGIDRTFRLHKRHGHLADSLMKDLMAATLSTYDPISIDLDINTQLRLFNRDKGWSAYIVKSQRTQIYTDELEKLLWGILDDGHTGHFKREVAQSMENAPSTFYYTPERWHLHAPQHTAYEIENTPSLMMVDHLASILLGYALQREIDDYRAVEYSIFTQLTNFVVTGKLKHCQVKNLDLLTKELPAPVVFLADDKGELTYHYFKFCNKCGGKINQCYCHSVKEKFNHAELALATGCWDCTKEMIDRAFSGNFDEKYHENDCTLQRDIYFSYFTEQAFEAMREDESGMKTPDAEWIKGFGDFLEITCTIPEPKAELTCGDRGLHGWGECENKTTESKDAQTCERIAELKDFTYKTTWKKMSPETIVLLWDYVGDMYSEGDYEPGEDECDCPSWGKE
jgi:hypothetical protein